MATDRPRAGHLDERATSRFRIRRCFLGTSVCGAIAWAVLTPGSLWAQENYEIQVYGSETATAGSTFVELHSNYTINGRKAEQEGLWPTDHAFHETLEIPHGFTPWSRRDSTCSPVVERGRGGNGRATTSAHESACRAPGGGRWVNPALDRTLRGPGTSKGIEFAPAAAIGYDASPFLNLGAEYYGAGGPMRRFDRIADQQHQVYGVVNLNLGSAWEFNAGLGDGFTRGTDHLIAKVILGRRFPR